MDSILPETYKGWQITLSNEVHHCSNFSFTIASPDRKVQQYVAMGGHSADDARTRAREMIDMEIHLLDGE